MAAKRVAPLGGDTTTSVVVTQQPCIRCAYSLVGLALEGKCPECGLPVQDSLRGILLRFASLRYREGVAFGSSLFRSALVLDGVLVIATVVWLVPGLGSILNFEHQQIVWALVRLIAAVLAAVGCLALTTRDTGLVMRESRWCARRVLRVAAVALLAIEVLIFAQSLLILSGMMMDFFNTSPGLYLAISYGMGALFAVSTIVVLAASLRYIGWLFERVPDQARQMASRRLAWVLPVVLVIGAIVGVFGPGLVLRSLGSVRFEEWQLAQFIGRALLGSVQVAIAFLQWRLLGSIRRELEAPATLGWADSR